MECGCLCNSFLYLTHTVALYGSTVYTVAFISYLMFQFTHLVEGDKIQMRNVINVFCIF